MVRPCVALGSPMGLPWVPHWSGPWWICDGSAMGNPWVVSHGPPMGLPWVSPCISHGSAMGNPWVRRWVARGSPVGFKWWPMRLPSDSSGTQLGIPNGKRMKCP